MKKWTERIPESEITGKITEASVDFARRFGSFLGKKEQWKDKNGNSHYVERLKTNQLRKFFGEVKRQQMQGFNKSSFIMLKPKLAYAVGRAEGENKIKDLYFVLADAIDKVSDEKSFNNFITIFEAIVAYHKAAEAGRRLND